MKTSPILRQLRAWKKANAGKYNIAEMGVFGSAARGSAGAHSDVDVVIRMTNPNLLVMVGVKRELEKTLNKRVDIIHRGTGNRFLNRRVEEEAVYV